MRREQRLALLATIIGSGIVILDSTVVNLALPKISGDLHASFADLQWIVDGYMLSLSALILLGGSLGDIFGRKRMYMLGLAGFGLASLLCGLSPNALTLIGVRILQGMFGALLVPGGLAIINTNFSPKERGAAIGSWSAWSSIFAALGPLLGGYILSITSWRWIFLINVPLVVICYMLGSISIVEGRDETIRRVDFKGATLAILALAGISGGLIEGPAHHWQFGYIAALAGGIILAIGFVLLEKREADPMVHLELFKSRNFSGSNLMTFGMYGALSGLLFILTIYLQTHLHYSPVKAGLSMVPVTIMVAGFSKRIGRLSASYGPRLFLTIGPLISASGMLFLLNLSSTGSHSYLANVFPGIFLFAIGLVMVVAPLTTTVMSSVADSSSGVASGINNAVSRVAGLLVIALLGLFGTGDIFRSTLIFCAILAATSGIISFILISNPLKAKIKRAQQT